MEDRLITFGPLAEIALASLPKAELERVTKVINLLRLKPENRRGQLSVRRLRAGSSKFIVRVSPEYRLVYKRKTPAHVRIEDIFHIDQLKSQES